MRCYRCNDGITSGKSFIPIDPKGIKSRRWVCTDCASSSEIDSVPKDVVELSKIINPDFIKK